MRTRVWVWIAAACGLAIAARGPWSEATPPVSAAPDVAPDAVNAHALTPQQIAGIVTLARAAALIRYLHPSDQAAMLDWDAFLPGAIDRVRGAGDRAALLAELRAMFAAIAPTAAFSTTQDPPGDASPVRGAGTHLARWRRYGFGPISPYPAFREGRDDETSFRMSEAISVPLADPAQCRNAHVDARLRSLGSSGGVALVLRALRPGQQDHTDRWPVTRGGAIAGDAEPPADTRAIELGLEVDGRAGVTLEALSLSCLRGAKRTTGAKLVVDPAASGWHTVGPTDLYTWRVGRCAAGTCATLARNPLDRTFVPARDLLVADLGNGIRIELPVAVWADTARTLPAMPDPPRSGGAPDPRSLRLAAVAATWGALSIFDPFLQDSHIDWLAALAPALDEAGRARDDAGVRLALRHLLAVLQDGHARVSDPTAPSNGILPIALRRFGDQIIVTGGIAEPLSGIAPGSELVAIDGIPAGAAYDQAAARVSAGTDGLRGHLAAMFLGAGAPGTVRQVRLRTGDGAYVERALRLVPRERFDHAVRPRRPWPGTELAPGVFYVDFDELAPETWTALVPTLANARALIFDFRGYSTTGLTAVSHLIDHAVDPLTWQLPVLPSLGAAVYTPVHRALYPSSPWLTAPVVALVDGQSASTVETILALIRDNHLGVLVGEPSAGSSGLMTSFRVPGGYAIQFTAIRLVEPDGSTLYGRGIVPDQVVHPTLDGVRAGRDEILEAGVAVAERLARP
jgi:hypothetical protein